MGSHPTLDHGELAAEARQLDPDDWPHGHAVAHLILQPHLPFASLVVCASCSGLMASAPA